MKFKSRIKNKFDYLRKENLSALVAFFTSGDPDLKTSEKIIRGLPEAGVDIIEIGMPFSDPMADGPVIQRSYRRSLKNGNHISETFSIIKNFRKKDDTTPIVLMGYYNPIYQTGLKKFFNDAHNVGVDGILIVDLPPEEDNEINKYNKGKKKIEIIKLATPTTDKERIKSISNSASGFIYYVSITGITGSKINNIYNIEKNYKNLKKRIKLPSVIGFGIDTPKKAKSIAKYADGIVIGSALIKELEKAKNNRNAVNNILNLVEKYSNAIKTARIN